MLPGSRTGRRHGLRVPRPTRAELSARRTRSIISAGFGPPEMAMPMLPIPCLRFVKLLEDAGEAFSAYQDQAFRDAI